MRVTACLLRTGRALLVALLVLAAVTPGWAQALAGVTISAAMGEDAAAGGEEADAEPTAGHAHDHDPSAPDHIHEAVMPGTRSMPGLRVVRATTWRASGAQPSPGEAAGLRRPPRVVALA
ncbi:hypothetical protein LPC08_24610 (plasmid) [Roseomonas sp. OT10]|uniref:hypothetical protein n=1 Tax=Roseomonas cutis TaxID=2897332 RepID=UPI001E5DE164|nr:hypothetical protein [Roseomonas sp. OT10]UFN51704.1 hypothetical protein LPC08_24610 [Roseomonas sp. OT10]